MLDYWHRQEDDQPLYEDILWSKPETKKLRKKLVLLGGNAHAFMEVAKTYEIVNKAGIGDCRVVLPKKLESFVGKSIDSAVYLENTTAGGIKADGVNSMLEYENWGDGVLVSGELGHGSETSLFINKYVETSKKPLILSGDSIESFYQNPEVIFNREDTVVVLSMSQLQKVAPKLGLSTPVTSSLGLVKLVEVLHELTAERESLIVTHHEGSVLVAMYGEVTSTHFKANDGWQTEVAASAAVFFVQHPQKPFQAVTMSITPITT